MPGLLLPVVSCPLTARASVACGTQEGHPRRGAPQTRQPLGQLEPCSEGPAGPPGGEPLPQQSCSQNWLPALPDSFPWFTALPQISCYPQILLSFPETVGRSAGPRETREWASGEGVECAGAGTGRCPLPPVLGLPVRSRGERRPLTQARLCSQPPGPTGPAVFGRQSRGMMCHPARDSGAEPARGNLGVSHGLPCRCPAHLGEGLFRAESPPGSIAYCLPSLPRAPVEPTLLKAVQGGDKVT